MPKARSEKARSLIKEKIRKEEVPSGLLQYRTYTGSSMLRMPFGHQRGHGLLGGPAQAAGTEASEQVHPSKLKWK